ncbi:hypothetical protein ES703_94364 [subsurface metagenome]
MAYKQKYIGQDRKFLMKFFNCSSSEITYLLHLISKFKREFREDAVKQVISIISYIEFPFQIEIIEAVFRAIGHLILYEIIQKYHNKDTSFRLNLSGDMVKDRNYKFNLSMFEEGPLQPDVKCKIVNEFNAFLKRS